MTQADENWRYLDGYGAQYQVSDLGNVRTCRRVIIMRNGRTRVTKERLLTQFDHPGGYKIVALCRSQGVPARMQYVHRLVAQAFLPNPDALAEVNHLNLDKAHNVFTNLEWCTPSRNQRHAAKHGRHSGRTNPNRRLKLTPSDADAILAHSGSSSEVGAQFGVSGAMVLHIRKGRRWVDPVEAYANDP